LDRSGPSCESPLVVSTPLYIGIVFFYFSLLFKREKAKHKRYGGQGGERWEMKVFVYVILLKERGERREERGGVGRRVASECMMKSRMERDQEGLAKRGIYSGGKGANGCHVKV